MQYSNSKYQTTLYIQTIVWNMFEYQKSVFSDFKYLLFHISQAKVTEIE